MRAGHPVVLPREAFLELRHSPAPTLKHYLQQTTIPQLDFPFYDPGLPLDLDYPEDYSRMAPPKPRSRHE
jgi:CTP:molybdopterin cytidylyltransferase MocA